MFKGFMIKVKDKLREFFHQDVRWYIGLGAMVFSAVLLLTLYKVCCGRLLDAIVDVGVSIAFYFTYLIGIKDLINPTVNKFPDIDIQTYVPFSIDEVIRKCDVYWQVFFDIDNFKNYIVFLLEKMRDICKFTLLFIFPLVLIFYIIFDSYANKDKDELKEAIKHEKRVKRNAKLEVVVSWIRVRYVKVVSFLRWFFGFYKEHEWIIKTLLVIWLVNTNIMTIIFEFFAYYFYFVCSFDILSVGTQLGKLVYDVIIMLWTLPLIIWAIISYKLFNYLRFEAAYNELEHMEARNRGYINTLPIVVLAVGPMGVGKTKTCVDMCLSFENKHKDDALELMDKNILRFPGFNFQAFEACLREQIKSGNVNSLATARQFIIELRHRYGRKPLPEHIWGYDCKKYPHAVNNGLQRLGIWEVLKNYSQEFFVYSLTVSSIISNIAIRSDMKYIDKGYFEQFNKDFFRRDPEKIESESCYAHIIDWDLFRIGCQINKEKRIAGSLEFGVVFASEIGKERQNTLELQSVKKDSAEANQKNDLFNAWLKYIRHNGTIENICFIVFIADEQRPESWGADARDLASVLHITSISERLLTLRFCFLPVIVSYFFKSYFAWYHKVKYCGNENFYIISFSLSIFAKLFQRAEYLSNTFGYYVQMLGSESGTEASKGSSGNNLEEHKYYLMCKKIYSRRYSTDAFQDIFARRTLEAGTSIYDLPCYKNDRAMLDELNKQNSYQGEQFVSLYLPAQVKKIVYQYNQIHSIKKGK